MSHPTPEEHPASAPAPAAAAKSAPAAASTPELSPAEASGKLQVRNVLVLTMCGVVVVLAALLITYFVNYYGAPQRDLHSEMGAPNVQTAPQKNPLIYAEWYLKRAREALNRKDISTCRMFLDDLYDELKTTPNALSQQGYLDLKDLEDDYAVATGR